MKKGLIIIIIVAILIIASVTGYFLFFNKPKLYRGNFQRNIQLNETQISDVTSFFSSSPSQEEMSNYCNENRQNCFYYCRNLNSEDSNCKTIMNMTRPGNMTRNGNYSRGGMINDRINP